MVYGFQTRQQISSKSDVVDNRQSPLKTVENDPKGHDPKNRLSSSQILEPPVVAPVYRFGDVLTQPKATVASVSRGFPVTKPSLVDKIELWFSEGRVIDGLWIGSFQSDAEAGLLRVEAALRLIERFAPLHYRRIKTNLSRIWVQLFPYGAACYRHSLNACLLDERFVASETTTVECIASAIVHEATHARLEKRGIHYAEAVRHKIERICVRRELDFVRRLPGADALREEINWRLDQGNQGDAPFTDRHIRGEIFQSQVEILRHLGIPEWVTALFSRR